MPACDKPRARRDYLRLRCPCDSAVIARIITAPVSSPSSPQVRGGKRTVPLRRIRSAVIRGHGHPQDVFQG